VPVLELKVPPPVVALVVAALMWIAAWVFPEPVILPAWRDDVGGIVAIAGAVLAVAAMFSFGRARTTLNPVAPERCSAVVTSGVFRVTRNPMYVGLLLAILGWMISLGALIALIGPPAFVAYIQRYQIVPEERALVRKFGVGYVAYMARVRRWI